MEATYKRNTDKDCIVDSNSAMSKGKYVPVCKKHNPKVKSHVPVIGCVLGLANVTTWDELIEKKMLAFASKHLHIAFADCICTLHWILAFVRLAL
ncbi:hypothetical protein Tco_0923428 [Tanacetum coccineum]|uniref:Uncharacterized protein n=1 Tax=Tanacetum coccineum TaxID=301880 RepID=A0ABQ5D847_9ASTR